MNGTERASVSASATDQGQRRFATFVVDGLLFGVEVQRVQEVLRGQEMTPVPRAPAVIEGLINLRGQIVTAIDVRRRLGLRPRAADQSPMNIVIQAEDGAVSLLVDEIGDVLDVEPSAFERVPENVATGIRDLATGVYKLNERLLLVLDTSKTIEVSAAGSRAGVH